MRKKLKSLKKKVSRRIKILERSEGREVEVSIRKVIEDESDFTRRNLRERKDIYQKELFMKKRLQKRRRKRK